MHVVDERYFLGDHLMSALKTSRSADTEDNMIDDSSNWKAAGLFNES